MLAAAACMSPGAARGAETAPGRIELVWVDLVGIDRVAFALAAHAVRELLAPLGLTATTRRERQGEGFVPGDFVVILAGPNHHPGQSGIPVVGAVTNDGQRRRCLWVYADPLARALGLSLSHQPSWAPGECGRFARALAVVVAHELAHGLADATHEADGLMAARLRVRELCDRRLAFDPALAPAFRAALASAQRH